MRDLPPVLDHLAALVDIGRVEVEQDIDEKENRYRVLKSVVFRWETQVLKAKLTINKTLQRNRHDLAENQHRPDEVHH